MTTDEYAIRRTLLLALAKFVCPLDLNTALCDDRMILLNADPARVLREWDELTAAEYLLPVPGFPEARRLSPAVRAKIEAGKSLLDDPFLAGASAVR